MNATIKIENIGTEEAKQLLGKPWPGQRNLRRKQVLRMAGEMKEGRFRLSHDAITVVNGLLANGQHRLSAVVEVGNGSYPFLVLRTNDPEIFKVIDDGMKRGTVDYIDAENACLIGAGASLVVMYDKKQLSLMGRHTSTRGEALEYFESHKESLTWAARESVRLLHVQRLVAGSVTTAFLEIGRRFDADQCLSFMEEVMCGEGSSATCKVLRERLIKNKISRFKMSSNFALAMLIKAYCAYYNARELKTIRFGDGETYPMFPGE